MYVSIMNDIIYINKYFTYIIYDHYEYHNY